jgi:hypothetical protein
VNTPFNPDEDPRRYSVSSFRLLSRFLGINSPWFVSGYSDNSGDVNNRIFTIEISHDTLENEIDILSKYIIWDGVLKKIIEYKVEYYNLGYHFNAKFIVEAHQPVIRNYDENKIITIPAIIKEQADILKTMQIFSN